MDRGTSLIIVIILFIMYEYQTNSIYEYFTSSNVVSSIDKRSYKVVGGFQNPNNAADMMAVLNKFIFEFLRFLKNKFIVNKRGDTLEQEFVARVLKNYNPDVIFENNPKKGEETSFVVNKGDKFGICLRNKKNKQLHDIDLLKFVIIHELSHLGTIKYGHEYQFWSWFKFMLVQAKESGLYTPIDYNKYSDRYCGMNVTFNPYYSSYDWKNPRAN